MVQLTMYTEQNRSMEKTILYASDIEKTLSDYDKIILIMSDDELLGLYGRFLNSEAFRNSQKRLLVLPAERFPELVSLYSMYEFSDNFQIIGRSRNFGGLYNYVDTEILSEEELFELVLR